jgi:ABC-type hemin transport system ATPase subunit
VSLCLLAPRRRATADACVPTIESSVTPAGVAAVDCACHRLIAFSMSCCHAHAGLERRRVLCARVVAQLVDVVKTAGLHMRREAPPTRKGKAVNLGC